MEETMDRVIEKIAIIGAGQMGQGIAEVSLPLCNTVLMKDVSMEAVSKGILAINQYFEKLSEKKKITRFQQEAFYGRIVPCDDYKFFKNTDLVIEAVVEDLSVKKKVLEETEKAAGPETIFASNTSALPIGAIAEGSKRPELVIGMHYFSPVPLMPLLEIIVSDKTASWVRDTALSFGTLQKKKCIVVKDGPAFYTTRILVAMLNQAGKVAEEGVDLHAIDAALVQFGFPVGPMTLLDEIGIDTAAHVTDMMRSVWEPRHISITGIFRKMNEKNFYGRKSRCGFFKYDAPKEGNARPINSEGLAAAGVMTGGSMPADEIQHRVALAMVNEAARCLEEGIIASPRDGDTGATLGLGFPIQKGGPFKFIDAEGAGSLVTILEDLQKKNGDAFAPAGIIRNAASGNKKFYL